MTLHPIQQAVIDLRGSDAPKDEKAIDLLLSFGAFFSAWLDCDSRENVVRTLRRYAAMAERGNVCSCGHDMSEGHLRHGDGWRPPAPTALAKAWTEDDQSEAFAEGWLLLVDREGTPKIVAVPGSDMDSANGMAEAHVRIEAEEGCLLSQKAVRLLDRETEAETQEETV